MDLRDYLRVLSRRWRAIALLALLGTAVGVLITHRATPDYRASAKLFVSVREGSDTLQLAQGNVFTQARVQSYAEVAASPLVTRYVVRTLGLDMTPTQLSRRISATPQPDTVLIRITVTDTRPKRAARISNAVAERFAEVIRDLERPAYAETSPVRLSITQPASVPSAPFSPRPAVNVALGLLAGLALGAGLAVARESMDRSVRSLQTLTDLMAGFGGPPVLGSVAHDPRATRHPVALLDDMHGLRAEGYRRLRTSLRFVDVDQPPKVIAVTSPLPREGKTSVAINLAATLAQTGASVCLVDADLRRPSIAHVMGLVRDAGLTTVLIGQAEVHQVLQSVGSFSVLTSGSVPPNPTELLGSAQSKAVLRSLAEKFDHVVVDTAPVLPVADASVIASIVDGYLLVVRASHTSRDQVGAALRTLQHVGASVLGTVLNMTSSKEEGTTYGYAYEYRPQRRTRRFSKRRRGLYVPPVGSAPALPTPGGEPDVQATATVQATDAALDGETRSMTADGSAQR
ncbi:polysaccharide biosynthesis tyrosine autokinase [Streptomyces tailanensis]|uniref:polysaccharide biosynthesis tyrosine autokinase n=1 Tax=Streptomyces tailanensis TaxID=2569858 RepID=UPI001FEBAC71|nr:polysaccharide biosynthesis tyrosine autokinase [Streptomyces tailanensis]